MAQSLMNRLRDETSQQHKYAETRPFQKAMAGAKVTREQYIAFLAQRFLIHRALEERIRVGRVGRDGVEAAIG